MTTSRFPRPFAGFPKNLTIDVDGFSEPLDITPTGADHAHISTKSGTRIPYTYRGQAIPLYIGIHVTRDEEKGWHVSSSHVSREWNAPKATPTLTKQVDAAVLTAFLGWITDHEDAMQTAQANKLNDAARTIEGTIGRLETVLDVMREKLATIESGEYVSPYVPEEHRNIF